MRSLHISDGQLAGRLGISRSGVQYRRAGGVRLREDQVDEMAEAIGVPALVFELSPDEVLRWLADNRSEQVFAASGWLWPTHHVAA